MMDQAIARQQVTLEGPLEAISVEYWSAGEGQPLLLLHGVADSAQTWQWIMPILARTHHVYALSFPGFGTSTKPEADYSPAFLSKVVLAFLDHLQLEKVSVVGNSLGGLVAMYLALAVPQRVSALVLVDSAGLGREITWPMRLLTLPGMGQLVAATNKTPIGAKLWAWSVSALIVAHPNRSPSSWRNRLYEMARDPNYLKATVASVKSGNTLAGQREREIMLDRLPRLTMPTLIIWGERDRIVPVHHAHAAKSRLVQGQTVILSDCGHSPQVEQPERFASAVSEFLNSVAEPSRI